MNMKDVRWMDIEEWCAEQTGLPDSVPSNAREWTQFIDQYYLVLSKIKEHGEILPTDVLSELAELFRNQYKKSIVECLREIPIGAYMEWVKYGFDEKIKHIVDDKILIPLMRQIMATAVNDLVPVQPPLNAPKGLLFFIDNLGMDFESIRESFENEDQ